MLKEELLKLDNLSIAEEKPGYFVHIHTKEGYILTSWNGEDIKEYHGSVCAFMPIRDEYPEYRIIGVEEHLKLQEEQRVVFERTFQEEIEELENRNKR
jgi:hypothetical protein